MKMKSIQFIKHEILGNLFIDFCDAGGKPVDTVILAGENGTGKSTILNTLFDIVNYTVKSELIVTLVNNKSNEETLEYYLKAQTDGHKVIFVKNGADDFIQVLPAFQAMSRFLGVFSDIDIDFKAKGVGSVTSLNIDVDKGSRRSSEDMSSQIQQLIVDIQSLDDAELSKKVRERKGDTISVNKDLLDGRMNRFLKAFEFMFGERITYDGIDNINNAKRIMFRKGTSRISLDNLSSGEKQIIYRGSFLLRDMQALDGAIVLLDEPEISMHPEWQNKIMEYYQKIFCNANGIQTSQIFAVTHSPFIIHNNNRKNDKIIVLHLESDGKIEVLDKPEYYTCTTKEAVKDAFNHTWYAPSQSTVYLEGVTDENYFHKAIEIYGLTSLPFVFKWIGHKNAGGQEEFTGYDSLDKAYKFSLSAKYDFEQIFLFDCDVKKQPADIAHSHVRVMNKYDNVRFKRGIENALVVDSIDTLKLDEFYSCIESKDEYGACKSNQTFQKSNFCDFICALECTQLKIILRNLKKEIDMLLLLFQQH